MRQLSSQDASFLYLDSRGAHLTLTGVYVYQQPRRPHASIGYDDVVRHVRSRLPAIPLLRHKLVRPPLDLDYPYWAEDPDFDVGRHIRRYRGPAPRSRAELYKLGAALHACPLDLGRPPWQMQVVERLGPLEGLPKNCFAIITRYHHSAIDGASGNDLIFGLHGTRPQDIRSAAEPEHGTPGDPPGTLGLLARAAVNNRAGQARLARSIARAVPRILSARWFGGNDAGTPPVPRTRFNQSVSPERVFHAEPIPLAEIAALRKAVPGVTVNDVVLTVCAGGLRRWLAEREELPRQSLVAMVPVNMRQASENAAGNQLAMIFMPIHTDLAGPLDRLQAVHQHASKAKAQVREGLQIPMLELAESLPSLTLSSTGRAITGLGLAGRGVRLCNCIITNVPSPHRTLYLGRARMVYTTGAGPILDGLGLIISLFTYNGQVDFSITSCPEILAEPDRLGRHFQAEFEALRKAARSSASG
jgi:diacylglycerol O-acyltransferase